MTLDRILLIADRMLLIPATMLLIRDRILSISLSDIFDPGYVFVSFVILLMLGTSFDFEYDFVDIGQDCFDFHMILLMLDRIRLMLLLISDWDRILLILSRIF